MEERLKVFWFSSFFFGDGGTETLWHMTQLPKCFFAQALTFCYPGIKWREIFAQLQLQDFTKELGHILLSFLHWRSPLGYLSRTQAFGEQWWLRMKSVILCKRDSFAPNCQVGPAWEQRLERAERKGCWHKGVALRGDSRVSSVVPL